jgi:hypothetical protein
MKKIDAKISEKFAKGLAVFTGKSAFTKITRGKFEMVSSVIDDGDVYYIDQWFPGHLGGGQELLEVGGEKYTRVYAGGTVEDTILSGLGITKDDVMACLKNTLLAASGKTRFNEAYKNQDGEWNYTYTPGEPDEVTGMITGKEVITYKTAPVFVHYFIISHITFPA